MGLRGDGYEGFKGLRVGMEVPTRFRVQGLRLRVKRLGLRA